MSDKIYIKLNKNERIIAAWAERANGPGWANTPLWFIIQKNDGSFRQECLQPEFHTPAISLLYNISNEVNQTLISELNKIISVAK